MTLPPLTHTELPPDVEMTAVFDLAQYRPGAAGLLLRADDVHNRALRRDLLVALGVDPLVNSSWRRNAEDADISVARLLGQQVEVVLAGHAQFGRYDTLDALLWTCAAGGAALVLVSEYDCAGETAHWSASRGGEPLAWPDVVRALPRQQPAPAVDRIKPWPSVPLPRADFALIRARCRAALPPAEFETVDATYRAAYRSARDLALLAAPAATRLPPRRWRRTSATCWPPLTTPARRSSQPAPRSARC